MVFLPNTNTIILLEPYGGTITEPGLPVMAYEQKALNFAIQMFSTGFFFFNFSDILNL